LSCFFLFLKPVMSNSALLRNVRMQLCLELRKLLLLLPEKFWWSRDTCRICNVSLFISIVSCMICFYTLHMSACLEQSGTELIRGFNVQIRNKNMQLHYLYNQYFYFLIMGLWSTNTVIVGMSDAYN
jgi:hypothetical protein